MNDTDTSYATQGKSFIPLTLLSLSLIIFFGYQLHEISKTHQAITSNSNAVDGFVNQNLDNYTKAVDQAQKVNVALSKLAADVMELSKTDENAKKVMDDLKSAGINFQTPAGSGSAAAPASGGNAP